MTAMEEANPTTGSSWIGNLTNNVTKLAQAAAPVITAVKGNKPTDPAGTAQKASSGGITQQTMIFIGIAVVLVIGGIILLTRGGKRA